MNYVAIKDLKQSRSLRERLQKEREIVVTKDGQPFALLIGITPNNLEQSLMEIRRAMFSSAVSSARKKAGVNPPDPDDVQNEIRRSRKNRDS